MEDMGNKEIQAIPFIALRDQTFFPHTIVGFDVARDKSLKAVELAMNDDRYLVVATQKDTLVNDPKKEDCYETGVLIKIKQMVKRQEEYIRILAGCEKRVKIKDIIDDGEKLICEYEDAEDIVPANEDDTLLALFRVLKKIYFKYIEMRDSGEAAGRAVIEGITDVVDLTNVIAGEIDVTYDIKQQILDIDDVEKRMEKLIEIIERENQILGLSKRIDNKVIDIFNKGQREQYLREKLHVIKSELGESDDTDEEVDNWYKKLSDLKLPEKTEQKIKKEIQKYSKTQQMSPDASVIRTYLETIFALPWDKKSKANINIKKAEKILNEDHYGLEKVKERILEHLAVMHLTKKIKGPILCLVGPPGVGKTSIARSIARATNREFIRMSLGGVTDEAEIRGHRRTYVGAIPGRVINSIIESGTNNPLFLFDEVDKIGSDFRGDPASALLEVLDPEQNKDFTDRYLEIPFNLSDVMFITTANTVQTIPRPLLDRMEVIHISSYIEEEKIKIAEKYLVPKKIKETGLKKSQINFSTTAIKEIIRGYTGEAGVRNLERQIENVCRKVARNIVTSKKKSYSITNRNIEKYLGKRIFLDEKVGKDSKVGITQGLAWTSIGGVTLSIETLKMPGTGKLILTGQLGDIMKESAQTALGYIRSIAPKYGIDEGLFKDYDVQIHIPEGATPKDGPSAGITMCTALFSTYLDIKAKNDIAMTGEITLSGHILPVGGIKEKVLAAYRKGITKVLIPKENESDISEIPKPLRKKIDILLIEKAEDAFKEILEEMPKEI